VSQPAHVGESCASADSCVSSGVCQEGYCVPPLFPGCFDGNVCTEDVCRNGGCGHTTAIGSCWALKGVVGFTATFRGKSCSCQQRYRGTLLLREDGTFAMPGGVSRCRSETIATPEETGTWHASRTRLALVTDNLSAIASAEARCTGVDVRIKGYRTWVKPVDGGTRLKGAHRHRQVTPRLGLTIATTARFSGKPGTGEPIPGGNGCVRQIVDCLND
jgi:hypothetical protein